jgi:hypothetical protein
MSTDKNLFHLTIDELLTKALEDGVINTQELEIIRQVEVDADSYNVILQAAMEDGIVTEKEAKELDELKSQILERAEIVAHIDGEFDSKEKALLSKLSDILTNHYKSY